MAFLKALTQYLASFFLIVTLVASAALPSNDFGEIARRGISTKLCDGDKINGALLNTFTPENPPPAALLRQCQQVMTKKFIGNSTNTDAPPPPPGDQVLHGLAVPDVGCVASAVAPVIDIQVAILHILHLPDRFITSDNRDTLVFSWGQASIYWYGRREVSWEARVRVQSSHNIARYAAEGIDWCATNSHVRDLPLNLQAVHGWRYVRRGAVTEWVEFGIRPFRV